MQSYIYIYIIYIYIYMYEEFGSSKFKYMEWKFEYIEYKFEYIEYKFEYMEWTFECIEYKFEYMNISLNILNICNSEWLLSIKEETSIGCNAICLETQETAGTQSFFTTWLHFHANFWTFTRYHKYSDSNAKCSLIQ